MTDEQKQKTRDRIGLRIYQLRMMKELSQEELARRAGLQRSHVSRIEAGKYAVTLETIEAIAQAPGFCSEVDRFHQNKITKRGGRFLKWKSKPHIILRSIRETPTVVPLFFNKKRKRYERLLRPLQYAGL